ncbi:mitochondrial sodium/calcium exchanger protein isoform X6 [Panthera tigris]|uniref:mitochondrial sodium/calcium exchanger protein isoform X6 n=1 Tax=Panthera tigris TaxID=9694 RepID=UPI001C6F7283|nr:mitochondrial sodium/calcium exchanger protein isoform X6 [Panthera tigris]
MTRRQKDLHRVLSLFLVLWMVETVSGARGPFTGTHMSSPFSASDVKQTPTADVYIQCREVCGLNVSDRCDFIRTNPDCRSEGGYLNYLEGIFCHLPPNLLPLAVTLYAFWLLYLFLVLGVTAAKFFCPNLSAICTLLKLSHNVAGVTFLAFGNGAPDIFSALVAFSDPRTAGLALGALFGAGVLVTTVVAGGIAILRPFTAASRPFLRDIVFYMVAVFLTFTALYLGRVTLAWALGYLGLYVFYVLTVVVCTWLYRWQRRRSLVYSMPGTPEMLSDSEVEPVSSNSYDYSEEYRPLLFYQETTAQILARALNPLDYRKWRNKSVYWRALKVLKEARTTHLPVLHGGSCGIVTWGLSEPQFPPQQNGDNDTVPSSWSDCNCEVLLQQCPSGNSPPNLTDLRRPSFFLIQRPEGCLGGLQAVFGGVGPPSVSFWGPWVLGMRPGLGRRGQGQLRKRGSSLYSHHLRRQPVVPKLVTRPSSVGQGDVSCRLLSLGKACGC